MQSFKISYYNFAEGCMSVCHVCHTGRRTVSGRAYSARPTARGLASAGSDGPAGLAWRDGWDGRDGWPTGCAGSDDHSACDVLFLFARSDILCLERYTDQAHQ